MSANRLKLNTHKTELLWAGSKHGLAYLGSNRPSLRLGADTDSEWACSFARRDDVRRPTSVWRSTLTLCSKCFFWLRQLKRVRWSLDAESMKTLVHAFVTSRVDYGNTIFVGAPNCNVFWTLLHGLSLAPGSMIENCNIYCILSCTGWTSRSGSCISLLWWSTDVSRTRRRSICRTILSASLWSCQSSATAICLSSSASIDPTISSQNISVVGLLLWLARRSGTHWQMNCELTLVIGLN